MTAKNWSRIRSILYAAGLVIVAYGLASEEQVALWIGLASALVTNILALANVRHSAARHGSNAPPTA